MKTERKLTQEELDLINKNVALAKFLYQVTLSKLQKRADFGIDPSDLFSEAYYGLTRAAMRYRSYGEERGFSEESIATGQYFSVFARKSIIGQMLDYLRKIDHVHTLVRSDYKALIENGLESETKKLEEVALAAGLTLERAKKVVNLVRSRPVYLDDTLGSDSEQTVGEQIADSGTVEETALETSLREALVSRFDSLNDLQKYVIAGKYYANRELPELAKSAGIPLAFARNAHTEALLSIHEAFIIRLS